MQPLDIAALYEIEHKSIPDIAAITKMPRTAVRTQLLALGVTLRTRAEGIRLASNKLGRHLKGKTRTFTDEWRANLSRSKRLAADATAKGTRLTSNGYVEYTRGPHKGRSVHVVAMEARIGRPLSVDEVVHHKDHNKQNNDINNLELMTRSTHTKLHRESEAKNGKR